MHSLPFGFIGGDSKASLGLAGAGRFPQERQMLHRARHFLQAVCDDKPAPPVPSRLLTRVSNMPGTFTDQCCRHLNLSLSNVKPTISPRQCFFCHREVPQPHSCSNQKHAAILEFSRTRGSTQQVAFTSPAALQSPWVSSNTTVVQTPWLLESCHGVLIIQPPMSSSLPLNYL